MVGVDVNTTFLARFDNPSSQNADYARGSATATTARLTTTTGLSGLGVVVSSATDGELFYSLANNLDVDVGTIEMWVKPLTWDGDDALYKSLFTARVSDSQIGDAFEIEKAGSYAVAQSTYTNPPDVVVSPAAIAEWQVSQWHHVAFIWGAGGRSLYVDGVLRDSCSTSDCVAPLTEGVASRFGVGVNGWMGGSEQVDAVIDELRISNIERSATDVRATFNEGIQLLGGPLFTTAQTLTVGMIPVAIDLEANLGGDTRVALAVVESEADMVGVYRWGAGGFTRELDLATDELPYSVDMNQHGVLVGNYQGHTVQWFAEDPGCTDEEFDLGTHAPNGVRIFGSDCDVFDSVSFVSSNTDGAAGSVAVGWGGELPNAIDTTPVSSAARNITLVSDSSFHAVLTYADGFTTARYVGWMDLSEEEVAPNLHDITSGKFAEQSQVDDVAATSPTTDEVLVMNMRGFEHGRLHPGDEPWAIASGDIDADGLQDLVVGNYSSGTVAVFLKRSGSDGDWSFDPGPIFTVYRPMDVGLGDVNGDGSLDIVVSSWPSNVTVFTHL